MKKKIEEGIVRDFLHIINKHRLDKSAEPKRNRHFKFIRFSILISILILLIFSSRTPQHIVYISEPQVNPELTQVSYPKENTSDRWFIIPGCAPKKIKMHSPVNNNAEMNRI